MQKPVEEAAKCDAGGMSSANTNGPPVVEAVKRGEGGVTYIVDTEVKETTEPMVNDSENEEIDIDTDGDPMTGEVHTEKINTEQLIPDKDIEISVMDKLLSSIEEINQKLEKLDVMERNIKDMNENMLKKGDVEKMIKEQLIPVKTVLTKHDITLKKQQTELDAMKKKTDDCIENVKQYVESQNEKEKDDEASAVDKKEIEEMIKKVYEAEHGGDRQKGRDEEPNKTNKNLIFHGMAEDKKVEDLTKVQDVAHDIGIMLHRWDVNKTSRLGAYEDGKKRPVKVELVSEITKKDFLKSKKRLKESNLYAEIQVVPDETKEIRHAKAILRRAAYLATRHGDRVWKKHDLIWVNGKKYTVETVNEIPEELRFKEKTGKDQRTSKGNTKVNLEKRRDDAEKDVDPEDMEVVPPQETSSQNFSNKNWDQAARAA